MLCLRDTIMSKVQVLFLCQSLSYILSLVCPTLCSYSLCPTFRGNLFLVSICWQKFTRFGCSKWIHCNRRAWKWKNSLPEMSHLNSGISLSCQRCWESVRTSCCPGRQTTKRAGYSAFIGDHLSGSNPLLILWPHSFMNSERLAHL